MSRLVRFQPNNELMPLTDAKNFWLFVRACFKSPRQMLGNNLKRTLYSWQKLPAETLQLRAQQLTVKELHEIWLLLTEQ
jgi:16S rRNA A1518/A1519 N6-dimethyltransferase RsmA/KsgA/DIM1 with predicted DNA glycosylase/AP lyase activity